MFGLTGTFGILAGIFSFSAYLFYIATIIRGETKPNRATWWVWSVVGSVIAISYIKSGATSTAWVPIGGAMASIIIAFLSIKYGVGGTNKFDIYCLSASVIGLLLWWVFSLPLVALVINILVDFLGALPTIKKSWLKPKEENKFSWTLTQIGSLLNLLAINQFTFGVIIYPVYAFVVNGVILGFLQFKKNN